MPKIGIILAGAASKGAYEIGCFKAIIDYFGFDKIKYVSSASIGSVITQAFGVGKSDVLENIWRNLDTKKHGRFFLNYSGNEEIRDLICNNLITENKLPFNHYVSVWNYTKSKVEYIPFHKLAKDKLIKYMRGAISIPIFSKGEFVDNDRILDGAFVDNIPAFPLLDKDLDYIFCIYFDNYKYFFENDEFNKKIIKLFDFPNNKKLDTLFYEDDTFDGMIKYGYDYATRVITELFEGKEQEEVYTSIAEWDKNQIATYRPRLTTDVVLNKINTVTKRYAKRLSKREKLKS